MKNILLTLPILISATAYSSPVEINDVTTRGDCHVDEILIEEAADGSIELSADFGDLAVSGSIDDTSDLRKRCTLNYVISLGHRVALDRMEFFAEGSEQMRGDAEARFSVSNRAFGVPAVRDNVTLYAGDVDFSESLGYIYAEDLRADMQRPGSEIPMTTRASVSLLPDSDGAFSTAYFESLSASPTGVKIKKGKGRVTICKLYLK